jgi:hypothetical protein
MSQQAVAEIIGRAITDPEFREKLIDDAAGACQGYDLTEEELAALEAIDPGDLQTFAENLPERLIRGAGGGLIVG